MSDQHTNETREPCPHCARSQRDWWDVIMYVSVVAAVIVAAGCLVVVTISEVTR